MTGNSNNSDSLHNDNTTSSVLSGLNNMGTKLEAIQEIDDNKKYDTSNGLTSQSTSSNENTSSNVRIDSKHERKKASNTPSIMNKAGRVTSAKKITTPVNIKLDYIKTGNQVDQKAEKRLKIFTATKVPRAHMNLEARKKRSEEDSAG